MLAYTTAAAVLLGIGLGWLLGRGGTLSSLQPPGVFAPAPSSLAARPRALDMVARAVRHDLALADTFSPAVQIHTLGQLAADLRHEALRLAQQGTLEDLPLVAALYQRVLRHGLVRRARALPASQQPAVFAPLAKQLQEGATEVMRIAEDSLPAVGDYLRAMSLAANETAHALQEVPQTLPAASWPANSSDPRPLLETVVAEGLRLAEEQDPLRRADCCSAVAEQLVQTILLFSAMGENNQAATLGKCLGEMVDRGVANNLNRVEVNEEDKNRLTERDRVNQRMTAASMALETNLQRAPPPARAGLRRAMEASRNGLERAAQAGKGKGKPKMSHKPSHRAKGRPDFPPGLEKKRNKDSAGRKEKNKGESD